MTVCPEGRGRNQGSAPTRGRLTALALLPNPNAIIGIVMPMIVNAFIARGVEVVMAARLGAAELFASAMALLCAPAYLGRTNPRMMAYAAIAVAFSGQLLSLEGSNPVVLLLARVCAGAGAGVLYATAVAALSATPQPDRALGLSITANQVAATMLLVVIPFFARSAPTSAAIVVTAAFLAAHAAFVPALPPRRLRQQRAVLATDAANRRLLIFCAAAGMALVSASFGMIWPLVGQLGNLMKIETSAMALGYLLGGVGAILGGIVATAIAAKVDRRLAVTLAATGLVLGIGLTLTSLLIAGMFLIMFSFILGAPFYIGLLAQVDRTGRLSVLTSAMIPLGVAAGQTGISLLGSDSFGIAPHLAMVSAIAAVSAVQGAGVLLRREDKGEIVGKGGR